MPFKRLCLAFFLLFILPIGNVWAARGSKRPGGSLDDPRYKKYRRLSPSSDVHDERSRRNRDDSMRNRGRDQRQDQWRERDRGRDRRRDDRRDHRPRDHRAHKQRARTSYQNDQGYRPQGSRKTFGDERRQNGGPKKISLNKLFKDFEGALRYDGVRALHNGCLNKQLDHLCDAAESDDFNQISVSRAFQVLSGFVKNSPQDEEQIRSSVKQHPRFVRTMMQVAENCMPSPTFYARTFTSLLYGCMHLKITPDEAWQAKFWKASQQKIRFCNPQEFNNILYAAAKLGLDVPQDWQTDFWHYSYKKLDLFNERDLINTLHAAANLDLVITKYWQNAFWEQSETKLDHFNTAHLTSILYSAAKLNLKLPQSWKKKYWAASKKKMGTFNPQNFSNTLYAAAKLNLTVPFDWQELFWDQSQGKLFAFSPQECSNVLYAAGEAQLQPPAQWQQAFWAASKKAMGTFNPQNFSNTLYAAAKLNLNVPFDWQELFWQYSGPILGDFNPQALGNTVYAACVLNLKLSDGVKAPLALCLQRHMSDNAILLQALFNANDYLKTQGIDLVFPQDTLAQLQQNEDLTVTTMQRKTGWALLEVLQKESALPANTVLAGERFIEATASSVDFFVKAFGPKGLIIQVDGPFHFLNKDTERQCVDGFTAFQTRCFKKAGYQVLRLPYDKLETFGVYEIKDDNSPVPPALSAYLKEQLSPHLTLTT